MLIWYCYSTVTALGKRANEKQITFCIDEVVREQFQTLCTTLDVSAANVMRKWIDTALENGAQTVETVIVVNRCNLNVNMNSERDFWWHDVMKDAVPVCNPEPMPAEQLLYLLYTSGTTAKIG